MASESDLTPSVLDRLLGARRESYTVNKLKEDIRTDIERFLNSRMPYIRLSPEVNPQLSSSILTFGRPNLRTIRSNHELEQFRQKIEDGIRRFEPRLKSVEVKLVGLPTATDRTLKLQIISKLILERAPVEFHSSVDMVTGKCLLRIR